MPYCHWIRPIENCSTRSTKTQRRHWLAQQSQHWFPIDTIHHTLLIQQRLYYTQCQHMCCLHPSIANFRFLPQCSHRRCRMPAIHGRHSTCLWSTTVPCKQCRGYQSMDSTSSFLRHLQPRSPSLLVHTRWDTGCLTAGLLAWWLAWDTSQACTVSTRLLWMPCIVRKCKCRTGRSSIARIPCWWWPCSCCLCRNSTHMWRKHCIHGLM